MQISLSPVRWWRLFREGICCDHCAVWESCSPGVHLLSSLTYAGQHTCFCHCQHILSHLWRTLWSKFTVLSSRLYERHGEAAVRSFSQFYPTITPADVMTMAQKSHFLAYLDNLVQSQTEEHRYVFHFILLSKKDGEFSLLLIFTFIICLGCHFCSPFLNQNHWDRIGSNWHLPMMLLNAVIPWPPMDSPGLVLSVCEKSKITFMFLWINLNTFNF